MSHYEEDFDDIDPENVTPNTQQLLKQMWDDYKTKSKNDYLNNTIDNTLLKAAISKAKKELKDFNDSKK